MKTIEEEIIRRVYDVIRQLKSGSINTIALKASLSWHATEHALKILEIVNVVKEDKQKTHRRQRYYKLI